MLDAVLFVIGSIEWFQGHTIVAHPVCCVLAETRVSTAWNFSGLRSPIQIDRILCDSLPRVFNGIDTKNPRRPTLGVRFFKLIVS